MVKKPDRTLIIEKFINQELADTPLSNHGIYFAQCDEVDPLLLVAINFHESNYCRAYPEFVNEVKHNCAGYMNGGQANGLKIFPDYASFISAHCALLSKYINSNGRNTIAKISAHYAPVDSSPLNFSWTGSVAKKYQQLWDKFDQFKKKF